MFEFNVSKDMNNNIIRAHLCLRLIIEKLNISVE